MPDNERAASGSDDADDRTLTAPPAGSTGEAVSGGVTPGLAGDADPIRGSVLSEDWGVIPAGDGPPEVLQGTVPADSDPAGMPVREADAPGSTEAAGDPGRDAP